MTFKVCRLKSTKTSDLFLKFGRVVKSGNAISFLTKQNIYARKDIKINFARRFLVGNKLLILQKNRRRSLVLVDGTVKDTYVEICKISKKFEKKVSKKYCMSKQIHSTIKFYKSKITLNKPNVEINDIKDVTSKTDELLLENPAKKLKISPEDPQPEKFINYSDACELYLDHDFNRRFRSLRKNKRCKFCKERGAEYGPFADRNHVVNHFIKWHPDVHTGFRCDSCGMMARNTANLNRHHCTSFDTA